MIKRFITPFCLLSSFFIYSAHAAWSDYLPQSLTRSDLDRMKTIARDDIEKEKVGKEIIWKNEKTGLSGTVKLIRRFEVKQFKCHEVEHVLSFKEGEVVKLSATLCKNPEGKIETLPFVFPNK